MLKNSILLIIFLGLIQFLFPKDKINVFSNQKYIVREDIKVSVKKLQQSIFFTTAEIAISIPYMELTNPDGQKIKELEGITYSFVNAFVTIGSAAIISFDLSDKVSKKYEITQLEFLSPDSGHFIYYLNSIATGKQNSQKKGCKDAYSFGVLRTPTLANTVAGYYKDLNWYYIIARITIKNKKDNLDKKYTIRINPKIYNDFQKELRIVYEGQNFKYFPIPIPQKS
ncbi:BB0158 famile outer surface lipoprotein [Candidatus Borreliella tachyglossi]|uniref:BB0158 famile outer surface lipoprotein n=1 Tax=Candidatus Borreliella tachyglossi TaxID=1964448 RepID=UPI0040431A25